MSAILTIWMEIGNGSAFSQMASHNTKNINILNIKKPKLDHKRGCLLRTLKGKRFEVGWNNFKKGNLKKR